MPTITDIKPQKKSDIFYSVHIDNKFAFSLSDLQISSLGLKIGQDISSQDLKDLLEDVNTKKAYHRALFYLRFRSRTKKEVVDYLQCKGFDEHSITNTIQKLDLAHLIDDEEFAHQWIKNRLEFRHYPLRIICQELRNKGVARDVLDNVLAKLSHDVELQSIVSLVNQKRKQPKYRELPKLRAYLAGKGFSYQLIKQATSQDLSREDHHFNKNSDNDQPK